MVSTAIITSMTETRGAPSAGTGEGIEDAFPDLVKLANFQS